jgi:hypothetical protein
MRYLLGLLLLWGCSSKTPEKLHATLQNTTHKTTFNAYWFQNKAEISTFSLKQGRYSDVHDGTATLVFVTEPFLREKQVKADSPASNPNGTFNVLKMNMTKDFVTGIYPYHMMMSVFTPIKKEWDAHTPKTNISVQERCGHVFAQLKLNPSQNVYDYTLHSYFEQEGEQKTQIERAYLEDEIWTRIRMNPKELPLGETKMIPAQFASRLMHFDLAAMQAEASLETQDKIAIYTVRYPALNRTLSIKFRKDFPYAIEGWTETAPNFAGSSTLLTTTATRKATILSDYWSKNNNTDRTLRKDLKLDV